MKCNHVRKIIFTSEYPETVTDELLEAKRHIKECQECREFIEGEKAFASMMRNAIRKDSVPEELKDRLLDIRNQKKRPCKKAYQMLAIAASILILAITGYIYISYIKNSSLLDKIVADHVKFLPTPKTHINTSNPDEIKAWFRGKVNFPVLPPRIKATLKGGRLCLIDKRHFILLFYKYNNTPMSIFITDGVIPDDLKAKKEVILKDRKVYVQKKSGRTILLWEESGLMYALISELDVSKSELEKIL